jgi:GNAT superfamily N-acetyltransferase
MISPFEVVRMAESIEVRLHEAYWALLPAELAAKRKLACFRVAGAFMTVAPGSVSLQRNRVLGLGLEEPATARTLDQTPDLFRALRVKRFSLHQSPLAQADGITDGLLKRGFKVHHHYSKLVRDASEPCAMTSDLRVRRIGKPDAAAFARVFGEGESLGWPADRAAWMQAAVGAPGFSHYLAFDGDKPVATGGLYVHGDCGWMGWAGTLPAYRRRGAHGALIVARVKRAAQLGAKWVVCETMASTPGRPGGAQRGLVKQGFKQAYLRPIWVWERN